MHKITSFFKGLRFPFKTIPYMIALISLFFGLRFGGMYGFYINSDGKGYYAYLPATFIYHDFTYSFIKQTEPKYYPPGAIGDFRVNANGVQLNKYFAGTALLWLPFFLAAHFISLVFGFPADGYAPIYQYSVLFAAVFYLWLGLLYLRKLLLQFSFSDPKIAIIQVLTVFASPVIFYTIYNPDYTHVYSFTLITIFTYYALSFINKPERRLFMIMAFFLGLIVLVRPMNGMIVLILPFIAGSWARLKEILFYIVRNLPMLLAGIFIFTGLVAIQLLFYYLQTGKWLIWSYSGEGFNFLKPHVFDVLFSYQRGLFLYTPLTFLALLGFIPIFRKSSFKGASLLAFLALVIYAISSWHCWWYGMCFSLRPMTEYMAFFAILLGYSFQLKALWLRTIYAMALAFTVYYNSVQLHQYTHYILHWSDMNKEGFWKVFLRTDKEYNGLLWGRPSNVFEERPANTVSDTIAILDFDQDKNENLTDRTAHSGKYSMLLNANNHYSPEINISCKNLIINDSIRLYASAYICPLNNIKGQTLHWVFCIKGSSGTYNYQKFDMETLPLHKEAWVKTARLFKTGGIKSPDDTLKIYLWNSSDKKICVDDMVMVQIR